MIDSTKVAIRLRVTQVNQLIGTIATIVKISRSDYWCWS